MRLAERIRKMSVVIGLLGVFLLLSLAGTDVLIAGLTSDELTEMGLQPE